MKGADEMYTRGTIDQCKGEVNLIGARTRASDMSVKLTEGGAHARLE